MRMIDADVLMEELGKIEVSASDVMTAVKIYDAVKNAPTVDDPLPYYKECDNCKNADKYEPKKGKWIKLSENDADGYRCSECGVGYNYPYYVFEDYEEDAYLDEMHFCPNCGARNMRESE